MITVVHFRATMKGSSQLHPEVDTQNDERTLKSTPKTNSEAEFIRNCTRTSLPATLARVGAIAGHVTVARVLSNGGEVTWSLTSLAVFGARPLTCFNIIETHRCDR